MMILVVGATGELGTTVVNKLVDSNHRLQFFDGPIIRVIEH